MPVSRWIFTLTATIALCIALLFLPHHVKGPGSSGSFTLFDILRDIFATLLDRPALPASLLVLLAAVCLLFTLFYPALFVILLRYADARWWFVLGGLIALSGAVVSYFAMVFSQTAIGFGGGSPLRPPTPFLWIIPSVHIVFALASISVGCFSKRP